MGSTATVFAQAFTDGNLVVNVIKPTATGTTGTAAVVNLRQFTTAGSAVGSDLVTSISQSWSATSEGFISGIHHDFKFDPTNSGEAYKHGLVFGGYSAAQGTASVISAAGTTRQLGVLDYASGLVSSFTLKDATGANDVYTGNNIRSFTSYDAGNGALGFATAGTGTNSGVRGGVAGTSGTVNTTQTSAAGAGGTAVTNWRVAQTNAGGTFATSQSGGAVGFNQLTPGSGNGYSVIFNETGSSFYDFRMFTVGNTSIVYVADDRAAASGGGIQKWINTGSGWGKQYTLNVGIPTGEAIRTFATTNIDANGNLTFYAIGGFNSSTSVANAGNSSILSFTDNVGNSTFTGSFTTLASAGAGETFKGIAIVPEPASMAIVGIGLAGLAARRRRKA